MNILFILNHKTLSDFEIPILVAKGMGIYLPKIYNSLSKFSSINVKNHRIYDETLRNISCEDKEYMDHFDFFDNKRYDSRVIDIIVKNFKIIILTLLTGADVVNRLSYAINGHIYYRFFGREGEGRYAPLIHDVIPSNKIKYILSYQEIITFERFLQLLTHIIFHLEYPMQFSNDITKRTTRLKVSLCSSVRELINVRITQQFIQYLIRRSIIIVILIFWGKITKM